ncbi:unnamed protein product, partial [Urochloa humidicola]
KSTKAFAICRFNRLLKQGLEINDRLQSVLSKYDVVVAGAPLAVEAPVRETIEAPPEAPAVKPSAPPENNGIADEEEEDEFAQLAQRKNKSVVSSDDALSSTGDLALVPIDPVGSESPSSVASNALVLLDPAPSSSTESKDLDMINLLSLTLCSPTPETSSDSPTHSQNGPQEPTVTHNQNGPQQPTLTNGQQYPGVPQYPSNYQHHPTNQGYAPQNSSYVAPWAQTGAYPPQPPAYASGYGYSAPPWAAPTPPAVDSNPFLSANYQDSRPAIAPVAQAATYAPPPASYPSSISYTPFATPQSIQHNSSFGSPPSNGLMTATQPQMNVNQQPKDSPAASSRPYYIPDNLFGDLIDGGRTTVGNSNGGQPMIGGKK